MTTRTYYVKRGAATVGAAVIGFVCAVLWLVGAVMVGSRIGEAWAGGRQVLVNNHGRIEVANEHAA
jgi:hypothetical protein